MMLLPSLILSLAGPANAQIDPSHGAELAVEFAFEQLGSSAVELVTVDEDSAAAGSAWRLDMAFDGQAYSAWLAPTQVRADGFRAVARGVEGAQDCTSPSMGTWRGALDGVPGAQVAVGRGPDGLRIAVLGDPAGDWFVQPASSLGQPSAGGSPLHVAYRPESPFASGDCGVADDAVSHWVPGMDLGPEAGGSCLSLAEIAFDVNYERYLYSSDVVLIQAQVDAYLNAVAAIHIRDFLVDYSLTHLEIRTSPGAPYVSDVPGDLLNAMRADWTSNLAGIPRDMAHLIVGQEMDTNVIGLAYVGTVCNFGFEYGLTQGNLGFSGVVSVLSHELGHNWNAPHCLDPAPCNQMCGGCTVFGPVTVQTIKNFVAAIGCLDPLSAPASPFVPFAAPESFQGYGPMLLDVMANDHDANCEPLELAVPAMSSQGGTLGLLAGAGPDGRDLVTYVPAIGFQGTDTFDYTVTDPGGLVASAKVTLVQRDGFPDLMGHYRLDNAANTDMLDSSAFGRDGTFLDGVAQGQPGALAGTGSSIRLAGAPQRARHPNVSSPMGTLRDNMTISVWVNPDQLSGVQRYYGNVGMWSFGQQDNRLLFTTHGIRDYLSGTLLQANQWQHVAAVFLPNHDVRFFIDGAFVGQISGSQPSAPEPANGWFVGTLDNASEYYAGGLDDLQVYDVALSDAQVAELFANPGATLDGDCEGFNYCESTPSSAGTSSSIGWFGSISVADQNFSLFADGAAPGGFGLFFYGANFTQVPAANGFLCVNGPLRMGATPIDALGFAQWPVDLTEPAPGGAAILGDSTWCFQFWYRDAGTGSGSNFSDGLIVRFCQ